MKFAKLPHSLYGYTPHEIENSNAEQRSKGFIKIESLPHKFVVFFSQNRNNGGLFDWEYDLFFGSFWVEESASVALTHFICTLSK